MEAGRKAEDVARKYNFALWRRRRFKGRSMSRSRHTEAEMIGALKQMEAGRKAEDAARELGRRSHTICAWKAKQQHGAEPHPTLGPKNHRIGSLSFLHAVGQ